MSPSHPKVPSPSLSINAKVCHTSLSTICKAYNLCFYLRDVGKTPEERAKLLETTPLFADIHAQAAQAGQTAVPTNLDTDLHFTCFVQAPDETARKTGVPGKHRLIELDGRRAGPVSTPAIVI
jgi:ubiquitin carboxyl-terminal hydrolase L3